ncbi:MAG TPA: hypothetical protein VND97_07065 [Beijerinckiaceae bacterium]|nr:hypothetical protein [Beijerinckiaceae bacterium]
MPALGRLGAVIFSLSALTCVAKAADFNNFVLRGSQPAWGGQSLAIDQGIEFGSRVWFSTGSLSKTLYGGAGSGVGQMSRLTYSHLNSYSEEAFGRIGAYGWSYFRGDIGYGGLGTGSLQDEDFPPGVVPYSSTSSSQSHGSLSYGVLDYGVDLLRRQDYRLSGFVGGSWLRQTVSAYGCSQTANNSYICSPGAVAANELAITQYAQWASLRLGVSGDVLLGNLQLEANAAWLPYSWFRGQDTHWLRTDIGPIDENGHGRNGVELEATASYWVTPSFSIGAGVRYWRLTADPQANFVDPTGVSLGQQPETFVTQRYGTFIQAAYRF